MSKPKPGMTLYASEVHPFRKADSAVGEITEVLETTLTFNHKHDLMPDRLVWNFESGHNEYYTWR